MPLRHLLACCLGRVIAQMLIVFSKHYKLEHQRNYDRNYSLHAARHRFRLAVLDKPNPTNWSKPQRQIYLRNLLGATLAPYNKRPTLCVASLQCPNGKPERTLGTDRATCQPLLNASGLRCRTAGRQARARRRATLEQHYRLQRTTHLHSHGLQPDTLAHTTSASPRLTGPSTRGHID